MAESKGMTLFYTLVPLIGLAVLIALGVVLMAHQFQRSLFRQRLKQESLKMQHQQELLRTAIAVQEQERQRIAADLHDELGARLSVALRLLRQGYATTLTNAPDALLPQLEEHLQQALGSTRRISYELMPPQLVNLGLHKALLVLVDEVRRAGAIQVELLWVGETNTLPWPVQLGLYRMIAELLHNTLKHAGASEVHIELHETDAWMECRYRDNGRGMPGERKGEGLGLRSLEGRTAALNGTPEWGNLPAGGFFTNICLPLTDKKETIVTQL